jgi:hypothetical protein
MKADPGKEQKEPRPRSFVTFSFLDVSGAVWPLQQRRIIERMKAAWRRMRRSKSAVLGVA